MNGDVIDVEDNVGETKRRNSILPLKKLVFLLVVATAFKKTDEVLEGMENLNQMTEEEEDLGMEGHKRLG